MSRPMFLRCISSEHSSGSDAYHCSRAVCRGPCDSSLMGSPSRSSSLYCILRQRSGGHSHKLWHITRDPFMRRCLRQLWFTASSHDFEVRASFVPGDHNFLPDALSRWHLHQKHQRNFYVYCRELALKYTFIEVPDQLLRFQVS